MSRRRAVMPAVEDVHGADLSVVDVVTDDAPGVPPVPAGRLDEDHARALTERIRLTASTIRERWDRLVQLVEQAKAGEVADVLGYASWTAYLSDVLGGQMRLAGPERAEWVGYLTGQGMSTRAIAPIVGASPKTVARDAERAREASPETPAPVVTGRDGKTYPQPAERQHVPVTPECPVCHAWGKRCKRPSGHDAANWHVAREDEAAKACGCPDCKGWLRGRARKVAIEREQADAAPEQPTLVEAPASVVHVSELEQWIELPAGWDGIEERVFDSMLNGLRGAFIRGLNRAGSVAEGLEAVQASCRKDCAAAVRRYMDDPGNARQALADATLLAELDRRVMYAHSEARVPKSA